MAPPLSMKSKSPPPVAVALSAPRGAQAGGARELGGERGRGPVLAPSGASASCEPSHLPRVCAPLRWLHHEMFADTYSWPLTSTRVPGTVGRAGAWPDSSVDGVGGVTTKGRRPRPRRVAAVPLVLAGLEDLVDPEDPMQSPDERHGPLGRGP